MSSDREWSTEPPTAAGFYWFIPRVKQKPTVVKAFDSGMTLTLLFQFMFEPHSRD